MTLPDVEDQRKFFTGLPREEQLGILFDMLSYVRSEVAVIKKTEIGFGQDLDNFKNELRGFRRLREKKEEERGQDLLNTTEKIAAALAKRFDFWTWSRDRVLPQVITLIIVGLLYLVFGGNAP